MTSFTDQHIIENSNQFEDLYRNRRTSDFNMTSFYELMKNETNRLRSFYIRDNSRWNKPFIKPEDLAKAGLFYLNADRVQCAFCTGVIGQWSPGMKFLVYKYLVFMLSVKIFSIIYSVNKLSMIK